MNYELKIFLRSRKWVVPLLIGVFFVWLTAFLATVDMTAFALAAGITAVISLFVSLNYAMDPYETRG